MKGFAMSRFAKAMVVALAVGAALAMMLMLAACNGGDDRYALAGTYKLVEIQSTNVDEVVSPDSVELLEALGMGTQLELKADGTGVFTITGDPTDITWEGSSITMGDMVQTFTISGKILTLSSGTATMVFKKL